MVHIEKNGTKLYIPRESFEADYKDNGWKIIETKKIETINEKPIIEEEIRHEIKIDKNKKK